jgi:hypothetical protein
VCVKVYHLVFQLFLGDQQNWKIERILLLFE